MESGGLLANIAILVLAGFVGFAVISKVPNTLHTPLMSGTNAIHGIVVLGALVVLGRLENPSIVDSIILVVAMVFGTINVIGGFLVTDRMLGMFKSRPSDRPRSERARDGRGTAMDMLDPDPLHRLVRAVHLRPDGPDRPEDRGARQQDRRGRDGASPWSRRCCWSEHRQLDADRRRAGDRRRARCALGARRSKMTAMPQMVALFNGVGGGAVALIAWAEFRDDRRRSARHEPTVTWSIASLFAAIIGSISFWGSLIAFGKLQEIAARPADRARQAAAVRSTGCCCSGRSRCAVFVGLGAGLRSWWIIGMLVLAAVLGLLVVLPIGGADMPVVISLLNALTGSVGRGGRAGAGQHGDDRGRHDRRCVRFDPDQPDGEGDEPVHPGDRGRRVRWQRRRCRRSDDGDRAHGEVDPRGGRGDPDGVRRRR